MSLKHMEKTGTRTNTLSVCIVAYNEVENIGRTLESITGWADEIIVLDSGSDDGTGDLARQLGAEVTVHPNDLNVTANKNVSFSLATCDWILCLDADEIIPDDLKVEIDGVMASNPKENGFKLPRRNFYFGTPLMHGGNYPDKQLRLFRRGKGRFPEQHIHERVEIDGTIGDLTHPFDHFTYPNFATWFQKLDRDTNYEALALERKGVVIDRKSIRRYMIIRPLRRWSERLFLKGGIKDGVPGVLAATFDLVNNVVTFGKFWMNTKNR